jgi:hypothetical protein
MKTIGKMGWALLLSGLLAGSAWADRQRHPAPHRSSIHWSVQIGAPWPYPYAPYYAHRPYRPPPHSWPRVYVPPVVISVAPPVYVEQRPAVPVLEPGYWYYCTEAQAYYPYVKQCPGDWQKVPPQSLQYR